LAEISLDTDGVALVFWDLGAGHRTRQVGLSGFRRRYTYIPLIGSHYGRTWLGAEGLAAVQRALSPAQPVRGPDVLYRSARALLGLAAWASAGQVKSAEHRTLFSPGVLGAARLSAGHETACLYLIKHGVQRKAAPASRSCPVRAG